jgi:hypothetical protein
MNKKVIFWILLPLCVSGILCTPLFLTGTGMILGLGPHDLYQTTNNEDGVGIKSNLYIEDKIDLLWGWIYTPDCHYFTRFYSIQPSQVSQFTLESVDYQVKKNTNVIFSSTDVGSFLSYNFLIWNSISLEYDDTITLQGSGIINYSINSMVKSHGFSFNIKFTQNLDYNTLFNLFNIRTTLGFIYIIGLVILPFFTYHKLGLASYKRSKQEIQEDEGFWKEIQKRNIELKNKEI